MEKQLDPPVVETYLPPQNFFQRNRLKIAAGTGALLSIILISLFLTNFPTFTNKQNSTAAPSPIPIATPKTRRVDTLPDKYKTTPQVVKYSVMGKNYIRTDAGVLQVIQAEKSYLLKLDNGETITASLDEKTTLDQASFEIDQNDNIIQILYKPLSPQALKTLSAGERVRIAYLESSFSINREVPVTSLVIIK